MIPSYNVGWTVKYPPLFGILGMKNQKQSLPTLPKAGVPSNASVRASMKANRSKGTALEQRLAVALAAKGLTGYVANDRMLAGSPDFSYRDEKVAVFVNGCFWHRCPYCNPNFPKSNQDYWSAKFERNRLRDRRNRSDLRSMGWLPIVVWECKVAKNVSRVVSRIQKTLECSNG